MKKERRKIDWRKIFAIFVMVSLIAAIISTSIIMAFAPTHPDPTGQFKRVKSDYVLMLLQCVLGVIAMLVPGMLQKRVKLEIPSNMMMLYILFLYCAIYLGEVRSFYYNVPHWDTILHTFSGAMLGALGFSFITFLNKTDRVPVNLSPLFVATFALCFAVTLGVIWEFYEFAADGILMTNMQKFAVEGGTALIGRAALMDTMKDLIVDFIGALVMSVIGYISLKHKKGWMEKLLLKIRK